MANNAIQIFDGTPTQNVINEATTNPADGETFGGAAVFDNTVDLWPMAIATLFITGTAAGTAGPIDLYCMKGDVGSGTEDEDAGGITYGLSLPASGSETQTEGLHYMGSFLLDSGDIGAQRRAITINLLGIKEAYFYLNNASGQALTQPVTLDIEGFTLTPSA